MWSLLTQPRRCALPALLSAGLLSLSATADAQYPTVSRVPVVRAQNDEDLFDRNLVTGGMQPLTPVAAVASPGTPGCVPHSACPDIRTTPSSPYADPSHPSTSTDPSTSPFSSPQSPSPFTPQASTSPFSSLSAGQGALTAQSSVAAAMMPGGYLDPAAPATMFRLRYDIGMNNKFPDRGEYFYAKCGCFRTDGSDPSAKGPIGDVDNVDYQDIRPYFEYAFNNRFSIFAELPVRFVDFEPIPGANPDGQLGNTGGLGDMNVGFKYALIAEPDQYLTFQFRTYIPTGDADRGLGNAHVSLEPSLLYYRRLSDYWLFQSQIGDFQPVDVTGFASNVLQFGAGVGYLMYQGCDVSIMPTMEVVSWVFLGGRKFNPDVGESSASGDRITNIKPGVRIGFGESNHPMGLQRQSVYAGFGIPVTSDKFYTSLFRLEYRVVF